MATQPQPWTLEELHRLPDDGNKYELVRGALFVTPPPSEDHEDILARLHAMLGPYVGAHGLGRVYRPRAVIRFEGSEVEPDLMVRAPHTGRVTDWDDAPLPLLVVEVLSASTRSRDRVQKRELYVDAGVGEYWLVDPDARNVCVVRRGTQDLIATDELVWHPSNAPLPLVIHIDSLFRDG